MSALDMSDPLVDELLQLEGVILHDLNTNVFVIAHIICILADNARASELANHLGDTANKFCQKCMVRPQINSTLCLLYLYNHTAGLILKDIKWCAITEIIIVKISL